MLIGVDEIGHHGDAEAIASTVDRRVGMVATCHDETITTVVNTPIIWPVMGAVREYGHVRQRLTSPSFDVAVEVWARDDAPFTATWLKRSRVRWQEDIGSAGGQTSGRTDCSRNRRTRRAGREAVRPHPRSS